MSIITPLDLIRLSLREAGVVGMGQTPGAEDTNDCFDILNGMMAQWSRRRWLVYHLNDIAVQANGAINYSVGPGGDFNMVRPDKIEAAYFIQTSQSPPANNVSYTLRPIWSREEYNQITLKTLASFPQVYFYDSAFPFGYLFVWPVPSNLYEIHITVKDVLPQFRQLTDRINLPPEYYEALHYNLAVRIRPLFQLGPDPQLIQLAKVALNTIKNANAQIPALNYPADLQRGGIYNIWSDSTY